MIDIQSSISILSCGSNLTLIMLFALLAIFGWLAIRYRNIKNFKFQIFVFIIIYVVGEILEDYKIPSVSTLLHYLGSSSSSFLFACNLEQHKRQTIDKRHFNRKICIYLSKGSRQTNDQRKINLRNDGGIYLCCLQRSECAKNS